MWRPCTGIRLFSFLGRGLGIPSLHPEHEILNQYLEGFGSGSALKGQCHEIIIFLKALKIRSVLSVYALMVFNFFASSMSRNVLLKFLIPSLKMLTNSKYFTGSRIRIPPTPYPPTRLAATQRELGASVQSLKLPPINHPPLMKSNTVTRFKIISGLRNCLKNHKRVPVRMPQ